MAEAARSAGLGYITRSQDWQNKPRHAKVSNLNNALFQTDGEFLLILDADQIPDPLILHNTLGYFADDPEVALVQTPSGSPTWGDRPARQPGAPLLRAHPTGQGRMERRLLLRIQRGPPA
ncbi:glycosyltransferase [Nesterenkonia pannonica]|uniref:glycosyltransferase n=1 Tax=Nesterenkonia pannonica TaxID=1548602 RepID=UPI002164169F|nr:glycosyltransferase [Nesterenkonia pannonica]